VFSFLKTNCAAAPSTLEIEAPARSTGEISPRLPEPLRPNKRVLLLDDMEDYREVLQEYLSSFSFDVTGVSNGAEGLREFLKDPFDLILCDMMMPKLNGEMFYWAVTRMRPAAGQRFIFLTGHQNRPTTVSFFKRINAVVLIKPFKLEDLRAAMHKVLNALL